MKKKVGFGIVLVLVCVCWIGPASWGSSYIDSTLAWQPKTHGKMYSSPAIDAKETIRLASGDAHKAEGGKKGEAGKGLVYEGEPYLVNLADAGGKRYLKLTMKMELSDAKLQEELSERNSEIRDALIILLSSKEYEDIATPSGKTRLKQEIMVRMNKMIKNGQIKEIFFTDFIVQ